MIFAIPDMRRKRSGVGNGVGKSRIAATLKDALTALPSAAISASETAESLIRENPKSGIPIVTKKHGSILTDEPLDG
jgi:hypothetical protein